MAGKKIVILGSGWGGIHAFLELHRQFHNKPDAPEVTIVSPNDYFLYNLLLHEVVTGGVRASSLMHSIGEIGRCSCGLLKEVVKATATAVDSVQKIIVTEAGEVAYDYVVIALGAVTRLFDFDPSLVFTLKDVEQAESLKSHILGVFEQAARSSDAFERKCLLTFVVIGGGPTGVELAADMSRFAREALFRLHKNLLPEEFSLNLIQSGSELVPMFKPFIRRYAKQRLRKTPGIKLVLNSKVEKVTSEGITLNTGVVIPTATVVLVAGVQARKIKFIPEVMLAKSGQVEVNEFLQLSLAPEVFVIGDMATIKQGNGFVPQTAQAAKYEGWSAGKNIAALIRNKPTEPFVYRELAQVVYLGRWHAAGQILKIYGFGPVMWLVWRGVDAYNFLTWKNLRAVIRDWLRDIFYGKQI